MLPFTYAIGYGSASFKFPPKLSMVQDSILYYLVKGAGSCYLRGELEVCGDSRNGEMRYNLE